MNRQLTKPATIAVCEQAVQDAVFMRYFWSKVAHTQSRDDCWLWQGRISNGYGTVWYAAARAQLKAHQIGFLADGRMRRLKPHLLVRHLCHNKRCCNPSHLATGNTRRNKQDNG